jgi:hypothetical protein
MYSAVPDHSSWLPNTDIELKNRKPESAPNIHGFVPGLFLCPLWPLARSLVRPTEQAAI